MYYCIIKKSQLSWLVSRNSTNKHNMSSYDGLMEQPHSGIKDNFRWPNIVFINKLYLQYFEAKNRISNNLIIYIRLVEQLV